MALAKTTEVDQYEIVGTHKNVQIRERTIIKEDGEFLSDKFHRRVLECVTSVWDGSSWTHTDTDVSSESTEIKNICNLLWTTDIKNAKKTFNESNQLKS